MIQDANEARELSAKAVARRSLASYLTTIEKAANDGAFEQAFGAIDPTQREQFKTLGFRVSNDGHNNRVSWGAT